MPLNQFIRLQYFNLPSRNVLSNLHSAPSRPHYLYQARRAIHLLHQIFDEREKKSITSIQQLNRIHKKEYPPASEVKLELYQEGQGTNMFLTEALTYLKPRSYLVEIRIPTTERPGGYRIDHFRDTATDQERKRYLKVGHKRKGRSKEGHILTDCNANYLGHVLSLAYKFLSFGSRFEFHLRQRSSTSASKAVDFALAHRPHLRPDVIKAAMPTGTTFLADPCWSEPKTRGRKPPSKKLTEWKTSETMWALELPAACRELHGTQTPKAIRQLGKWDPNRPGSLPPIALPPERYNDDPGEFPGWNLAPLEEILADDTEEKQDARSAEQRRRIRQERRGRY